MIEPNTTRTRRRSDGEQTHTTILGQAMRLASIEGLNSLTIGRLADVAGISKSGLYAHFGSKERLQLETIEAAWQVFEREVILPALDAPEGLERLEALCEAYISYVERGVFPGGCFFAGLISEFDAQPGPIHEMVATGNREWVEFLASLILAAQERGELDAAVDPEQLAFEIEAVMEFANYLYMLHRDPVRLERGRAAVRAAIARAAPE